MHTPMLLQPQTLLVTCIGQKEGKALLSWLPDPLGTAQKDAVDQQDRGARLAVGRAPVWHSECGQLVAV